MLACVCACVRACVRACLSLKTFLFIITSIWLWHISYPGDQLGVPAWWSSDTLYKRATSGGGDDDLHCYGNRNTYWGFFTASATYGEYKTGVIMIIDFCKLKYRALG